MIYTPFGTLAWFGDNPKQTRQLRHAACPLAAAKISPFRVCRAVYPLGASCLLSTLHLHSIQQISRNCKAARAAPRTNGRTTHHAVYRLCCGPSILLLSIFSSSDTREQSSMRELNPEPGIAPLRWLVRHPHVRCTSAILG